MTHDKKRKKAPERQGRNRTEVLVVERKPLTLRLGFCFVCGR